MLIRSPISTTTLVQAIIAMTAILPEPAQAGVVIDATRVIYPASRKEVSVSLHNTGEAPSLVQTWTDAGEASAKPGETRTPFALPPPLFRLDPAKGQTLRLTYTQEPLPTDRETIFWLNVLDIPPRVPTDPNAPNRLEMAFRHRLKVLFRPQGLPGKPADAARAVTWAVVRLNGRTVLEASNPTPYFISFAKAEVTTAGATVAAVVDMVAPFASKRFALTGANFRAQGPVAVQYGFVDDFGAVINGSADASVAPD